MKIRVADLHDGPCEMSGDFDPEPYDLRILGNEIWSPLHCEFHAEILGEEILVRGLIRASVKIPCARCLEPLPLPVEIPGFACAIPFTTEDSIDLTLQIREDILLNLPMASSCQLDAKGKCPHTGVIHAKGTDTFAEKRRGDIWEALERFKEEGK